MPVTSPVHSALDTFLPTLHQGTQYPGGTTHKNDNERGRKNFIGHIFRQVGRKFIDVPRLKRLPELFNELAFGGHVRVRDSRGSWKESLLWSWPFLRVPSLS